MERQQVLRRLGYGAVVDGVWGPRARSQWNQFLRDLEARPAGGFASSVPRPQKRLPVAVRRENDFLGRQMRFNERLNVIRTGQHGSQRPGGLTSPGQAIGISPAGRRRLAQEAVQMKRHQEKWRLAKRNPILMRAYFGGHGQAPSGEASVPWGQDFVTRDLAAEDVEGLLTRDLRNGNGLFLKPVQLGKGKVGIEVTARTVAMLTSWLRVRGVKLPANPRSDELNRALASVMRRARWAEVVRHRRAVRRAYFDSGLAQAAMEQLGVPRGGTTIVGGDIARPAGHFDLYDPVQFADALASGKDLRLPQIFLQMAVHQEKAIVDENWQRWRAAIIDAGPLLGLSSGGVRNFEISNPFLPDSVVKSDSETEFRFRQQAERVQAYAEGFAAYTALQQDYAVQLSEQTGDRYVFHMDQFIKGTELGLAARFPSHDMGGFEVLEPEDTGDAHGPVGWLRGRLKPLSGIIDAGSGEALELGAKGLAKANAPATWTLDVVLAARGWWMSGLNDAGTGAGLQYVSASRELDATGAVLRHVPGHFMGLDEAYARGHVYREALPGWAEFILESAVDPLNFVGANWIKMPLRGLRRLRGGVDLAERTVRVGSDEFVIQGADAMLPTGTAERQVGGWSAQLESKVDVLKEVDQEVLRAEKVGEWEQQGLAKTTGQIADLKRINEDVGRELLTAPMTAPLMAHMQRHSISLYRNLDRRDLSPTGYYLLGRMEQWMRGSVRRQVQRAYPELELPDFAINGFGHGPVHPTVQPLYEKLVKAKRLWIETQVLPAMQTELMRRSPMQFAKGGQLVPTEAQAAFERELDTWVSELVADQVEVPNHIFGQAFSTGEKLRMVSGEVDEIVSRAIGRDRRDHPEMWLDQSDVGDKYRQNFKRVAAEAAHATVSANWLAPGDRWGAAEILQEVRARTTLAQEEAADLKAIEASQLLRQDAILDVAGEYLVLTHHLAPDEKGEDLLAGLFRWTNAELAARFVERHPNYDALGPLEQLEKRRGELAIAFARDQAGLPEIDWTALALRGKMVERQAKHVVTVNAQSWEAAPRSVLTMATQRKTIERVTELFFEADLVANDLGRDTAARKALETSIDQGLVNVMGGHATRQKLLQGLRDTVLQTPEVVRLRTGLEDVQRRYVQAADELQGLHRRPDVPHSELRARGREIDDLRRQMYAASNAYFAQLWSTADHGMLRQTLQQVRQEREYVQGMLRDGGFPEGVGRMEVELLDRTLQIRTQRLELVVDLARNRRSLVEDMKPRTGQFAMRSAMADNLRELSRLRGARHQAEQLAKHYQELDLDKLTEAAGKGAGGWLDVRSTVTMPRSLASHVDSRAQNLSDVSDEAESVAWMMHDQEFVVFPELARIDRDLPIAEQAREVSLGGDQVPHALVPTRQATPVDRTTPMTKAEKDPGGSAWSLAQGMEQPNRGAQPALSEGLQSTDRRWGQMTPEAVLSEAESVRRFGAALRERQGAHKAYADAYRGRLLRERQMWLRAAKFSSSMHVRGLYWSWQQASKVWKTAILPFTIGWSVINYIDGSIKAMVKGIADPRLWMNPNGKSFPELFPLSLIGRLARVLDRMVPGANAAPAFERWVWTFYGQHRDRLDMLFGAHGIEFPAELMDNYVAHAMRVEGDAGAAVQGGWRQARRAAQATRREADALRAQALELKASDPHAAWELMRRSRLKRREGWWASAGAWHEFIWEVTSEFGEGRFRKAGYVHWYRTELNRSKLEAPGLDEIEHQFNANQHALEQVDHTYFSKDSLTVAEDNLSVLWPFVNFVRKNTQFWAQEVYRKPGLLAGIDRTYEVHTDDPSEPPSWLERYFSTSWVAQLPLFSHLTNTLFKDGKFDPLNLTSLGLLWRSFKEQNDQLTDEQGGIALLNLFASSTNDIGLGMAPWIRKPAEAAGLISMEFWRDVFPQTSMVQAFDAAFFDKRWPDGLNLELLVLDPIYQALVGVDLSQLRRRDFDTLVNREIAGMKLRGEQGTAAELRERAERKVSDAMIVRNVWNWFTHVYIRRVTPADAWFYLQAEKMHSDPGGDTYEDFSARQKLAYSIYKRRKEPVGALDKWVGDQGLVQYYHQLETAKERSDFYALHPELIQYIGWRAREFTMNGSAGGAARAQANRRRERAKRNITLAARTDVVMNLGDAAASDRSGGGSRAIEDAWRDQLVTPELEDFWARNDTPADDRRKMMRLEYQALVDEMSRDFFALPEGDHEARAEFLRANPLLVDVWRRAGVRFENGTPTPGAESEDLHDLVELFRGHARDYYFMLMDAQGYDAASAFLKQHSDIFIGTKSALRISEPFSTNAVWLPSKRGDALSTKYLQAKPWLDLYFHVRDEAKKKGGEEAGRLAARAVGAAHPIVYEYFDLRRKWEAEGKVKPSRGHDGKLPQLSQHAKDYLAVKDQLDVYFGLPERSAARRAYADAHPEIVAYFRKYSKGGGGRGGFHSHRRRRYAQGWVAAQSLLDAYFDLEPGPDRVAYLAKHPELGAHVSQGAASRSLGANRLHIARRYEFWMRFFALAPDEREAYVRAEAVNHGVFVYGVLGAQQLYDNEQSGMAWKFAHGELSRQQAYLMVRPLLDLFFSLPPEERSFYEQLNPEITIYMRLYAHHTSLSGNAKIDKEIAGFFDLPDYDSERKQAYLEEHPAVQKWLHSRGTPEERAMGRLIDAYFKVPKEHRPEWLLMHPEVLSFFDVRSEQRDREDALGEAFDELDPRLDPYEALGYEDKLYAETIGTKLRLAKEKPTSISVRREREFEPRERVDTT